VFLKAKTEVEIFHLFDSTKLICYVIVGLNIKKTLGIILLKNYKQWG